jgi:biopolymer transport protein ExbD
MAQKLAGRFTGEPIRAPNLTPLVGVFLALFAGVAGLAGAGEASTDLRLPPIAAMINCWPVQAKAQLVVGADGSYRVDGRIVEPSKIDGLLAGLAAGGGQRLAVRADPDAAYGAVAPIVHAAARSGLGVDLIDQDDH